MPKSRLSKLKGLKNTARDRALDAATRTTELALLARETAKTKATHFMAYVESEAFEQDLDLLGQRLEIPAEKLQHAGPKHWDRVTHKATVLAKHTALEAVTGTSNPKTLTAMLPFIKSRKALRWMAGISAGATLLKIGYHCYQVFVAKEKNPAPSESRA